MYTLYSLRGSGTGFGANLQAVTFTKHLAACSYFSKLSCCSKLCGRCHKRLQFANTTV